MKVCFISESKESCFIFIRILPFCVTENPEGQEFWSSLFHDFCFCVSALLYWLMCTYICISLLPHARSDLILLSELSIWELFQTAAGCGCLSWFWPGERVCVDVCREEGEHIVQQSRGKKNSVAADITLEIRACSLKYKYTYMVLLHSNVQIGWNADSWLSNCEQSQTHQHLLWFTSHYSSLQPLLWFKQQLKTLFISDMAGLYHCYGFSSSCLL